MSDEDYIKISVRARVTVTQSIMEDALKFAKEKKSIPRIILDLIWKPIYHLIHGEVILRQVCNKYDSSYEC